MKIQRSINEPIRSNLSFDERWNAEDRGLITSWEAGREMAVRNEERAELAKAGDMVELPWKRGSWFYLAMLQGLKSEDLNIDTSEQLIMVHRYENQKGESVEREIQFPESGTCPDNLKTLKGEDRVRELYFD